MHPPDGLHIDPVPGVRQLLELADGGHERAHYVLGAADGDIALAAVDVRLRRERLELAQVGLCRAEQRNEVDGVGD
ncbi:hypothetical protein GCM10022261_28990 [Brevibacterium daeguense]|uniref:Uncharacterized protein n=1 Tax=Brevibacterium daeguense TaxID=909936 RepID=A0ABP8EN62_9MICO